MGYDYALVHLIWTIPPALLMTGFYWPFFTQYDHYKIWMLVTIALIAATPWDSYLIRNRIWTYPETAVVGPTMFKIPLEEVFFFFIQTYNTSLLYSILTKRLVLPCYLRCTKQTHNTELFGTTAILCGVLYGIVGFWTGGKHTYMSLILGWLCPLMLIPWIPSARFLLALPRKEILMAVFVPTVYLWLVDALALQRGTWVIEADTKLNIALGALDIEEAVFFLCTNIMIVIALAAIDHGIAIAEYQMAAMPRSHRDFPTFMELFQIYLKDRKGPFDVEFLRCVSDAVRTVAQKSQTMYTGSAMFRGQLRIDLILLYSFCRVMDDLVDDAPDVQTARRAIQQCRIALHRQFTLTFPDNSQPVLSDLKGAKSVESDSIKIVPPVLVTSTGLLPVSRLTIDPLLDLLDGFESDLAFNTKGAVTFPIETDSDLELYAYRVAGTVATSVLQLITSHYTPAASHAPEDTERIIRAGSTMGQALQYVNIARDIQEDASIGRVYIPTSWLKDIGLTHDDILATPRSPAVDVLRERLLCKADGCYQASVAAMNELPADVQGPIRTVVNCYMLIGRVLRENKQKGKVIQGRLKVPILRRLQVAWISMMDVYRELLITYFLNRNYSEI